MLKLFDFTNKDGSTFVAKTKHTARFQHYMSSLNGKGTSPLSLEEPEVKFVYDKLMLLESILTSDYDTKSTKSRIPPAMGHSKTVWKEPAVLFSRGSKDPSNGHTPKEAYVNQPLHTDYDPYMLAKNTMVKNKINGQYTKAVPYSVIINCTPGHDAVVLGCGIHQVIGTDEDGDPVFKDVPPPQEILIPPGHMIAFRGDYVHAGTSYE